MPHSPHVAFKQHTPTGVLQSIATITSQRDRDLLARTLLSTLTELTHSNRITMYRILPTDQGEEAILVAEACAHPDNASTHPEASIAMPFQAGRISAPFLIPGRSACNLPARKLSCPFTPSSASMA